TFFHTARHPVLANFGKRFLTPSSPRVALDAQSSIRARTRPQLRESCRWRSLILPVESSPEDTDRAPVTVERRVSEELVIQPKATALSDGKIIIRFQGLLAVVAQVAVAVKNARAARL